MNKKFGTNPISQDFSVFSNESHDYLKNINLSKEYLSLYISFMQSAPISIVFINEQEQILFTNKNFEYRARKGQTEMLGQPISDIFPINLNKNDREEIFFQTLTKGEWSGNLTYLDKKEYQKKIWLKINQFKFKDGDTLFGIQFFDSGTRNFRSFSENALSYLDTQTNLPNFNRFAFDINQAIWKKETKLAGLALIRCQNASEISMHHSRQTQKFAIKEMVERIQEVLPRYFYLYRLSREVFALYSSDYEKEDEFKTVVHQIRTKLLEPFIVENQPIFLILKFLGAIYPGQVNHLAALLQSAEVCLNQRETSKIIYFSESMNQKHISHLQIIEKLESACAQKKLQLKYQPIMNQAGTMKVVELSLDWQDEELGNISPKQILAATQEYGHTYKMNQWLLNEIAKEPLFKQLNIIVKIEASQLIEPSFLSEVRQSVKKQALIPNHI